MTEVPPFLFVLTSTALVLGAAITVRGLLGFRSGAESAAPSSTATVIGPTEIPRVDVSVSDSAATVDGAGPSGAGPAGEDGPTVAGPTGVRDLKEPFLMTFVGVLICIFTLLAISALIHSV